MTGRHRGSVHCSNNSGSALLLVLTLLALAAFLALVAARTVSTAAVEMSAAKMAAQSEEDLRSGIELGAAAIIKLGESMRSASVTTRLLDRDISIHITNERAFIDLNKASVATLSSLFVSVGVDKAEAAALAGAVEDWRGGSASQNLSAAASPNTFAKDPLTRVNGLASDDGREIPQKKVGTRYFLHPAQLASIPGFTHDVTSAILPLVTVASGSNEINPFIAPIGVLKALPGVTASAAEAFVAARDAGTSHELALTILGADKKSVTEAAALGWRLEIVSRTRPDRTYRGGAVIAIVKEDSEPFRILYVNDH
ncbi:MAG: hypothetical protein WBX25_29795 [Rhodomicrobium sp.]